MCSNLTLAVVLAAYVPERRSLADARPDATDRDRGRVTRCPDSAAARLAHDGSPQTRSDDPQGAPKRQPYEVWLGDPLDANSRRRGRWWSLGRSPVRQELVGGVHGRLRCCTPVLYGARRSGQAARSKLRIKSLRETVRLGLSMLAPQAKLHVQTVPERDRTPVNCSPDCNPGCNFRLLVTPWCCTR
jgi:hypothetical protein